MWWIELRELPTRLGNAGCHVSDEATVAASAVLVGEVRVEAGAVICHGAYIEGPVVVGRDCLIGNNAMIRGPAVVGDRTRIGFAAEIKNAIIAEDVLIGPQCYVADSKVERGAYLGAQVRTSNQRLDRGAIHVVVDGNRVDTGMTKLGCLIGAHASLGVQVIVLPGRIVASGAIFAPRITIEKNLPSGQYHLKQDLECVA